MQGFDLISLCIVMYKSISKILASRLKLILPSLVDIAQSTFIPARSISDNILLAHELFHGYEKENSTPKCSLKIDLHKAFDSVHWDFILAVLRRGQIPEKVIKWISACIFSTRFSVMLNGVVHGFFKEGSREGSTITLMVDFVNVVEKICILQPDDPKTILEDTVEIFHELENNGFHVNVVSNRVVQMLSIKDKRDELQAKSKESTDQIEKRRKCQ
ncbi:hypothetical protein AgCh_038875 [Apium graveolens]